MKAGLSHGTVTFLSCEVDEPQVHTLVGGVAAIAERAGGIVEPGEEGDERSVRGRIEGDRREGVEGVATEASTEAANTNNAATAFSMRFITNLPLGYCKGITRNATSSKENFNP